jgi:RNA polymerase sigma-70 factor (ECF subfamily)
MTSSDAQLIALAREARTEGLELLYRTHRAKIYTFLLRLTGDADAADDCTQDTFVKAYRSLGQLKDDSRVLPWLYRIASNTAIDAARRRKQVRWIPLLSLRDHVDEPHASDDHTPVAERQHIDQTLRAIPLENAAALLLHVLEGYSYKEIADIQGVSMTAVRSRIARARVAFRELHATERPAQSSTG